MYISQVKAYMSNIFNNIQNDGDCQSARKYAEGGYLTGDFAGEE
jgi:hypothetical protein